MNRDCIYNDWVLRSCRTCRFKKYCKTKIITQKEIDEEKINNNKIKKKSKVNQVKINKINSNYCDKGR